MADARQAHSKNAPGDFYVDTSCIDCPTCRQIAPATFGDTSDQAVVANQPNIEPERLRVLMALVSCPAGSIGCRSSFDAKAVFEALPESLAQGVYYCGFASPDSYGAHSYLIKHAAGNVLMDSPRFAQPLVKKLESLGGIRFMLLTHRDDVVDHEAFARHFHCERVMHEADALSNIEKKLTGEGPWPLASDLKIIWVPGHTRGHIALLYRDTFLFSGDHLFWRNEVNGLDTSHRYNQYSWEVQIKSLEKLLSESFTWILPGHGYRYRAVSPEIMDEEIRKALALMCLGK